MNNNTNNNNNFQQTNDNQISLSHKFEINPLSRMDMKELSVIDPYTGTPNNKNAKIPIENGQGQQTDVHRR